MLDVKWIFFDIGSTLIDESACYKLRYREAVAGTAITPRAFEEKALAFFSRGLKGDHEAAKYFGVSLTPWHTEAERPYPDALPVLERLWERGYRLGIIANQSPGTRERLSKWGLLRFFDVIMASAEEGVSKPDIRIFTRALKAARCAPGDAAMVGDRQDNDIAPAKTVGMRTVLIRQGPGGLAGIADQDRADCETDALAGLLDIFLPICPETL